MKYMPLGLRAKLYTYPWMMALIMAITIGVSVLNFMDKGSDHLFVHELYKKHNFYQKSYKALAASCIRFFEDRICTIVKNEMKPEDLMNLEPFLARVNARQEIKVSDRQYFETSVRELPRFLKHQEGQLKGTTDYQIFAESYNIVEYEMSERARGQYKLTRDNIHWLAILKAQFTHTDWVHLLDNLLVLLLFSMFLEQRVGHIMFAVIYLLAGTVGLFAEARFLPPNTELMGASANVLGIIGAYAFFFWKEEVFLFAKRTIPAWILIVLGVLGWDIGGGYLKDQAMIAYVAHAAGFMTGVFAAFFASQIVWVQAGFLFLEEQVAYLKAKRAVNPPKKIKYSLDILEINPGSVIAVDYIFRTLSKHNVDLYTLDKKLQAKITEFAVELLRGHFPCSHKEIVSILSHLPLQWDWTKMSWPTLTSDDLWIIDNVVLEHDWKMAIRLYDLFLHQHKKAQLVDSVTSTVQKVLVHLESPLHPNSHQNIEWLRRYSLLHSKLVLGAMIGEKFASTRAS